MSALPPDLIRELTGVASPIRAVFQPVVEIESQRIVGYEALARFPNVPDLGPTEVFARARARGRLSALDWECRRAAVRGAVHGGLHAPKYLFVNVEPGVLGTPPPWPVDPDVVSATARAVPTVIELTERALLSDPRSVLRATDWAHEHGCLVALDDVGANADSIAVLGVVAPDIIKLDRSLLVENWSADQLRTLRAVWDHVGETGAYVLCEGIETERDLDIARALGATLAQGFHFGRPGELHLTDAAYDAAGDTPLLASSPMPRRALSTDPTAVLAGGRGRPSSGPEIGRIAAVFDAMRLNRYDNRGRVPFGCVLVSLPEPQLFTPWLARRAAKMARTHALVGIIGVGEQPVPGVRGSPMQPIRDHLAIVMLDADSGVAIVGRDLGDPGPPDTRRFEWTVTTDDTDVIGVARSLLRRLSPSDVEGERPGGDTSRQPADGVDARLTEIAEVALRVVPGVDSVSLTMAGTPQGLRTLVTTDQYPYLIDQFQQLYREGPSMQGPHSDPFVEIRDLPSDDRWPVYRSAVAAASPVASVLSYRLFDGADGAGFLTLYAESAHAFDATALESAHAVAEFAAAVWIDARASSDPPSPDVQTNLPRTALSDLLDAAVAVTAARTGTSPETALRSILEDAATIGATLQQTARRSVAPSDFP